MAEDWLEVNRDLGEIEAEPIEVELIATQMKFDAPPERLWEFILLASSLATTDWQFSMIGVEFVEHILGWHGEEYIRRLEDEVPRNKNLARTLNGLQQYMMSDEVFGRLKELERRFG